MSTRRTAWGGWKLAVIAAWLLGLSLGLYVRPGAVQAQDDDLGDFDETPRSRKAASTEPDDEDAEPEAAESAEGAAGGGKDAAAAPVVDEGPSIVIQPFAGVGMAMRGFRRPTALGVQALDAAPVPAVEVGLTVKTWPNTAFSWVFSLVYQSALGFTVTEAPPLALENKVRARSERVAADIAPSWRTGMLQVAVPIGASMRTLWPEIHHSMTPGYSLIGPHARLDVSVRGLGPITLRLIPEVQWIALIDELLVEQSGVEKQGVAVGGEFAVDCQLVKGFSLAIFYRESHALIATTRGSTFTDIERYLTMRFTGTF